MLLNHNVANTAMADYASNPLAPRRPDSHAAITLAVTCRCCEDQPQDGQQHNRVQIVQCKIQPQTHKLQAILSKVNLEHSHAHMIHATQM